MNLIEAQISELKNLKLIYAFSTDSIFGNNTNKYVGLRVVYDNDRVLSLDYKSEYFQQFVTKVLEKYNIEKENGRIVLLGDFTRELINNSSFAILEDNKIENYHNNKLAVFHNSKQKIKPYLEYLKKIIYSLLIFYKGYEMLIIDNIDGFHNKYIVTFSVGSVKKTLSIIISVISDNEIEFRVGSIDGHLVDIRGTITNNCDQIYGSWYSNLDDVEGTLNYDSIFDICETQIRSDGVTGFHMNVKETLDERDASVIDFYLNLFHIDCPENILKINDGHYILGDSKKNIEKSDQNLFTNRGCQIIADKNGAHIRYHQRNSLSKYHDKFNVVLDQRIEEVNLKKIEEEGKAYILVEFMTSNGKKEFYKYNLLELEGEVDLSKPFTIKKEYSLDENVNTIEDTMQLVRKNRGGVI